MDSKIAVIIPCFNQARFLAECVNSVLTQKYNNWECIIVNDGSTDHTDDVCNQLILADTRIKYIKKINGGLSSARNAGIHASNADYFQFLDADDILDKNKFIQSTALDVKADIVISDFKYFRNKQENAVDPPFSLKADQFNFISVLLGWDETFVIPIHCGLFKSHLFKNVQFNEDLKAKEDWVMWLQIFQQNVKTVFINAPLAFYRLSPNSMSQNKTHMNLNVVAAYKIVYGMLPDEYREVFFRKSIDTFGKMLAESNELLIKTRHSKSYRFGNFFVNKLNRIKKFF